MLTTGSERPLSVTLKGRLLLAFSVDFAALKPTLVKVAYRAVLFVGAAVAVAG